MNSDSVGVVTFSAITAQAAQKKSVADSTRESAPMVTPANTITGAKNVVSSVMENMSAGKGKDNKEWPLQVEI